ncbi:MAG TPA: hypothetical protein DCR97_05925, partial [Deltaproteobacteria bacterium]|nr:hypothetical protein [Deltaproteobacteria bacterium]
MYGVTKTKIMAIVSGVVALIALVTYAVILSFDINSYKSKIEDVLSTSTGLHIKINGKVGLSFLPFGVSAKDIEVSGKGGEILSLEHLKLGAKLLPLLKKKLKVTSCVLVRPALSVVKGFDGKYNFESGERGPTIGLPATAFTLNHLKLSDGTFVSIDKKTGEKTELKDINLAVRDLTIADISGEIVKNVSFTGNMDCKEMLRKNLRVENIKTSAKAIKGLYSFEPLTMGSLVHTDKKTGEKTELK